MSVITKLFWKTVKSFLYDKIVSKEQILLVENDEIIYEESKIAELLNPFFPNIVKNRVVSVVRTHDDFTSCIYAICNGFSI